MNPVKIALAPRTMPNGNNRALFDNQNYLDAIKQAGGFPCILPTVNQEQAAIAASTFDGLCLTGGDDVNPSQYGQSPYLSTMKIIDAEIEESEILLYQAFLKAGKPIFGICRGIQIINVIEGGTLIQDIPSAGSAFLQHQQNHINPPIPGESFSHKDSFEPGSVLASIFSSSYGVNSFHHQAIDQVAPGFKVTAISEDGIIEGIEKKNVLAVQWHPERLTKDKKHFALFEYFVNQCKD